MYQHLYKRFINANPKRQHFACHSHYYWPDVSREAHIQYWDDSARYVDEKWGYFFSDCVPELQGLISKVLNLRQPEQIVFAPNTHELLYRILSCFEPSKPLKVLTTDSEFHSFNRQISRLEELPNIHVTRIATQPFESFEHRMQAAIKEQFYDLVFFSQVFFNSGVAVKDVDAIVAAVPSNETIVVVDGYHSFMAKPYDASTLTQRAFYLAGGYKYAQGGEGGCFAVVPEKCAMRPIYTGWYAEFGELSAAKQGEVNYSLNGMRFAGATMDFSALYRMRAVMKMFDEQGLTTTTIDNYIYECKKTFLNKLDEIRHSQVNRQRLLMLDEKSHGHFLTFELDSPSIAKQIHDHLANNNILTDYRGNRLRFGFALYHEPASYDLSSLQTLEIA